VATREAIIDAAVVMLREDPGAPFSHEVIAARTGIAARTIYRHFPTRADLTSAFWVRIRDDTGTRWPETESGIATSVKALFRQFERHAPFVRAAIAAAAATNHPAHGSAEGRAAFGHALEGLLDRLPPGQGQQLIAACLAIYSAPFWQMLRDRGQLSSTAAAETAAWVLEAAIGQARRRAGRSRTSSRRRTGAQDHASSSDVSRPSGGRRTYGRATERRR
jgi:AcrR family transcriptional regulator